MKEIKHLNSNKGITLLVLSITIVVMLILSFTISVNVNTYAQRKKKTNLTTDLKKLQEKVEIYYSKNKEIPIANKYINTQMLEKNVNDNENYYVIEISKLGNLELNYGKDYEEISDKTIEISDLLDIYIINEQSHTIYYPKGVKYDGKMYYTLETNYQTIKDSNIDGISITGENTVNIGESITLKAQIIPTFAENTGVTWKSSDETILGIDENGIVTAKKHGVVTVTATSKDNTAITKDYEINVTYPTVQLSVIATKNSTVNGNMPSYSNPIVPKGFKAVDVTTGDNTINSNAKWTDVNGYKYGLVIEDEEQNQFVWVAVDGSNVKLDRYNFSVNGVATSAGTATKETYYIEQGVTGTSDTTSYGNTTAKDINGFIKSVNENGGYYIARFEASYGIDNKPNSKKSTVAASTVNGETPSEEGAIWNNINEKNAATVCQNMYVTEYGVESDLVNSYAWDTALYFIQQYSEKTNYSVSKSGNIGTNTPKNTGETEDVVCNIYDLSGNYREWTTETSTNTNKPAVSRGGTFYTNDAYASYYYNDGIDDLYYMVSFRPILYIK